jgi:DNA polymerase III subunit delta'
MTILRGHDEAVAAFLDAAHSRRLHHAWLLAGPQGIGKARFAEAAALRLLAEGSGRALDRPGLEVPPDHPTARLIEAGSHPDFQRLERLYREKTGDYARNISIDQVRGLQGLFGTTPTFSSRRVVVIDAIDDLERGAANALLKSLEEPPPDSLFLLISHAPGRLLPTIRSRCRLLRFAPLADDVMTAVLRDAMPDADPAEIAALVAVGEGSPGRALRFAGLDIAGLDETMNRLIGEGDPTNAVRSALARLLAAKSAQARYEAFLERAPGRIAAHARGLTGQRLADAITIWEQARALSEGAVRLSLDPQTTIFEIAGLMARLAPAPMLAKA